jgi:hypothetical protein
MTCEDARDRLDDLVDGALVDAARRAVEAHVQGCPACGEELRQLRALLAEAQALPRERTPPRDLWPGIAREISPPATVAPFLPRPRFLARLRSWSPALAAAAVAAVALSVVLLGGKEGTAPGAGTGTEVPVATGRVTLLDAERGYALAAEELLAALDAHKHTLSPETRESVERNLAEIDKALREIREALAREPQSPGLTRLLASTHRKKVETLRRVVRLSGATL